MRRHGFLAMEYYWLILNRSFVVFTYPEGLYAWKFSGPVSTFTPLFFVTFEDCTTLPNMVPGTNDFESLMKQRDSFSIPRGEIASVDYAPRPKWGMGNVPHSGRLYVHLKSGNSREMILLGSQNGDAVRDAVLSGTPIA